MTIATTLNKKQYTGNNLTTEFPIPFPLAEKSHLFALVKNEGGIQEINNNFSIDLERNVFIYPVSGEPLKNGDKLTIYRKLPLTQIVDLENAGAFHPEVLEHDGFDRIIMQIQQLDEIIERSLKIEITDERDVTTLIDELFLARDEAVESAVQAKSNAATAKSNAASAKNYSNLARAWAESSASPDGNASSKSAKSWAELAKNVGGNGNYATLDTAQTITGAKTLTNALTLQRAVPTIAQKTTSQDITTIGTSATGTIIADKITYDKNDETLFRNVQACSKAGYLYNALYAYNKNGTSGYVGAIVYNDDSDLAVGIASTPPDDSNTNHIATTAWARKNLLALTGNQTVAGEKTFTSNMALSGHSPRVITNNTTFDVNNPPSVGFVLTAEETLDKNGVLIGRRQVSKTTSGYLQHFLHIYNKNNVAAYIGVGISNDDNNTMICYAQNPPDDSNNTSIATTSWVNAHGTKVTRRTQRSSTGTWTISNLVVGKPLFLICKDEAGMTQIQPTGGTLDVTDRAVMIGNGPNSPSTNCMVIVPNATTVTLNVTYISGIVSAYQ